MRRLMLFAAACSLAFAPVPVPKDRSKEDLKRMQGRWVLIATKPGIRRLPRLALRIEGNNVLWEVDLTVRERFQIVLDATRKHRTWETVWGVPPTRQRGVYVLHGETLTLAYNLSGPRPSSLKTAAIWYIFERVKPKGAR